MDGIELIVAGARGGKTAELLRRLAAAGAREPLLAVPTIDDVARFERLLCAGRDRTIGIEVVTFEGLIDSVATAIGVEIDPAISAPQRLRLLSIASGRVELGRLRAPFRGPSAIVSISDALDEVQGSGLGAIELEAASQPTDPADFPDADPRLLGDLARILRAYRELLDELGRVDRHDTINRTLAALRSAPQRPQRPVFAYGFDDLSGGQLDLLSAIASSSSVTIALTHQDRPALAARATLRGRLEQRDARTTGLDEPGELIGGQAPALQALERSFLSAPEVALAGPGESVVLIEAAGERGEAEVIAAECARLIADGIAPDAIAVALRSPSRLGPLYDEVLRDGGVGAAVNAELNVAATAVGRGLLGLLDAIRGSGAAVGLLAYLRTPGVARSGQVDWLERAIRRERIADASAALAKWKGHELREVTRLGRAKGDAELCAALAEAADRISAGARRRSGAALDAYERRETRAALAIATAAGELAELGRHAPGAAELSEALSRLTIKLWQGPGAGRVRVASPYRLRGGQFSHLFCASLVEGEFPTAEHSPGLLGDAERGAISLPRRASGRDEENFLFYTCISRPSQRLYLSTRLAAEDGSACSPSPFIEEVASLFADWPAKTTIRAGLGGPSPGPESAPTQRLLARSLARLAAPEREPHLAASERLGLPGDSIRDALARVEAFDLRANTEIKDPAILASLLGRSGWGAGSLEQYLGCPQVWFIEHQLRPQRLEPTADNLSQGALVHAVLHELFKAPPGSGSSPTEASLPAWLERAAELQAQLAPENGLAPEDPTRIIGYARVESLITNYLRLESTRRPRFKPQADLLEAEFGPETERGGLELNGLTVRGRIDRIDVGHDGAAPIGIVRDYKSGSAVTAVAKFKDEGKLQLPLYMLALRDLFGIEPVGGFYEPLGKRAQGRPRGIVANALTSDELGFEATRPDRLDDPSFDQALRDARDRAESVVAEIGAGGIPRNPIGGTCPKYCGYAPICRRERGALPETDLEELD